MDHHWRWRCASQLQVVPVATWPAGDAPAHDDFGQILDLDGTVLLCFHEWGAHEHPSLMSPDHAQPGNGLLLFFRVDDFDMALPRARAVVARLERGAPPEPEHRNYGFSLRDPDGYYVTISAVVLIGTFDHAGCSAKTELSYRSRHALGRRGRLLVDLRQPRVDAGPMRCGRCPNRHCRIREIRVIKSSDPHENQMRPHLSFAEERRTARRTESTMQSCCRFPLRWDSHWYCRSP